MEQRSQMLKQMQLSRTEREREVKGHILDILNVFQMIVKRCISWLFWHILMFSCKTFMSSYDGCVKTNISTIINIFIMTGFRKNCLNIKVLQKSSRSVLLFLTFDLFPTMGSDSEHHGCIACLHKEEEVFECRRPAPLLSVHSRGWGSHGN